MCIVSRSRVNDNMDIFLDERRMTQRDLTIMFGERDLFLSMLNPRYVIDILPRAGTCWSGICRTFPRRRSWPV